MLLQAALLFISIYLCIIFCIIKYKSLMSLDIIIFYIIIYSKNKK